MFGRKNKTEKIVKDIQKKEKQIESLKEDIKKMAKLALKDGKLKVADEEEQKVEPGQPGQPVAEEETNNPFNEEEQYDEMEEVQMPPPQQPQYRPQPQQPQYRPQPQQPQYRPQPQQPQQQYKQQQEDTIDITIRLIEDNQFIVPVFISQVDDFINKVSDGIDNQSTIQINNKIINCRNILWIEM